MPEPLVCEDVSLTRLLETVHSQPGSRILYQDTVRRGGVLGFFARQVHRVAYEVAAEVPTGVEAPTAVDLNHADLDHADLDHADLSGADLGRADLSHAVLGSTESDPIEVSPAVEAVLKLAALVTDPPASQPAPSQTPDHSFEALLRSFDETSQLLVDTDNLVPTGAGQPDALADLLSSTDAIESAVNSDPDGPVPDFAELLQRLTMVSPPEAAPTAPVPLASVPGPAAELATELPDGEPPNAVVRQIGRPDARARLELLMQLRQVGVPVSVNPRAETHNLYQALDDILAELPAPVEPPRVAGAVIAIVGESTPALRAAHALARTLRIAPQAIGVAGLPEESVAVLDHCLVTGAQDARRLRRDLSLADTPSIVVIATDATTTDPNDPWAREMLAALAPTASWAVVDARWKTEDSRAQLSRLGPVDALVVHAAELSKSPASVWDLDLPLALLDDRPPTAFAWTGLLFRLLATDARHRASA